jgi:DNA invertase Pin-like site-specific DNA recombinase
MADSMRCAVYARFSSELQRDTSIDDQLAIATRYAADRGWAVVRDCVFTDSALSGASLERPGIRALRAAAQLTPRPFDVLLVDDSSRVSRDLADAVRLLQELQFAGARVIYISQNIDSANEQAETLVAVHGVVDSLYLREMAKKIRRGLAGQLSRGFATGSITYGYRTVPVIDPSGKVDPSTGYPVLSGKRVEIVPDEATNIVRIFERFAAGLGATRIVIALNQAAIPGPRGQTWKIGAVKRILANERYTGRLIWGQKRFERRPGTRQKVARAVPREQWHIHDRPELRIVSDAVWSAVQRRRAVVRALWPEGASRTLMRGKNAALHSRALFSGFMRCGICGGSVVLTSGGHGAPRYGCLRSIRNGRTACHNRVEVQARVADDRLLAGLKAELLDPDVVGYIADQVSIALNRELQEQPGQRQALEAKRTTIQLQLDRLLALAEDGQLTGPTVATRIAQRERELRDVNIALAASPAVLRDRLRVIPTWVKAQLVDLSALLGEAPERTKAEFQRMGLRVAMQPIYDEQPKPFYRATVTASLPNLTGVRDLNFPTTDRLLARAGLERNW